MTETTNKSDVHIYHCILVTMLISGVTQPGYLPGIYVYIARIYLIGLDAPSCLFPVRQ